MLAQNTRTGDLEESILALIFPTDACHLGKILSHKLHIPRDMGTTFTYNSYKESPLTVWRYSIIVDHSGIRSHLLIKLFLKVFNWFCKHSFHLLVPFCIHFLLFLCPPKAKEKVKRPTRETHTSTGILPTGVQGAEPPVTGPCSAY